ALITSQGIFCYTKIPFGLRNAGATYQHPVDKAFHKQIGSNLKVYVDDLVIKIRMEDEIVRDIEETSKTLREINMKLNTKKYTFGVEKGMFLGYKVNTKGLKVCPDKTTEAEEAFKQMKRLIAELPMLTEPMEKEELIVYLATTKETVSAFLMTEREAKKIPIYFVSRALWGPEINYTSMEKLVLALVHASKRLKRYFQAHPIIVIMDQPIQQVLSRPEVAVRLQKWSIELGEYAIHYRPRVPVKGQILVDFIVERPEEESPDTLMEVEEELFEPWIYLQMDHLHRWFWSRTDTHKPRRDGVYLCPKIQANVDSRLVANQVNGTYVTKEADMIRYLEKVKTLTSSFKAFSIRQVPRSKNKKADALSKIASISFAYLSKKVLVEELKEKSISKAEILAVVEEEGDTWMTPIFEYLTEETLPADEKKARVVYKPVLRNPQQKLTPITSPWPFYKWRIDIAGSFPKGPGKAKFLIVAIDYFTKWIEAKPVATITGNHIKKFIWDNIVCRFELPGEIISDNGKQFQDSPFKDLCEKLCIRQHFASVKHPQTNGLVERANRSLGEGIKARLDERSKNWMEELPHVLWAHAL
ncbi:reverse transcriptase domain-containing protein, partial [Tanacetum coccineum]